MPVAAMVETLERRVLLSSIVVNSTNGGQNYLGNVTVSQLDPSQTSVTLRDAVDAANNTAGNNTISFDPNVFPSNTKTPTTIVLSGGTPLELNDTSGTTTIAGPGAGQVAVSGNGASTVFLVDAGVTAEIDGLTITGGNASVNLSGSFGGGGIFNSGTLTLQNDIITANTAGTYGGGLYNAGTGNVTVSGSAFTSDSAQLGGGFFNTGTVSVSGSAFIGDSASSNGGGFYNQSTVTVTTSTFSTDTAGGNGGGFYSNNSVAVSGSTLSLDTAGTFGGGFFVAGNATLSESTLSQNTAAIGGGIANFGSTTVTASTIAGNFGPTGGGIFNIGSKLVLVSTIVAQNTVSATNAATSDWAQTAADSTSSYNLIGDGTNSGLANGVNHNIVGNSTAPIDPHLSPLANNGGPTQTMALLAGSPAINAGNNTLVAGLTTDQRGAGFSRIAGGTVDIGAFEIQSHPPAAPSVNALISNSSTPVLTGDWDDKNAIVLQVTVNGTTYTLGTNPQLTGDGAGHWKLATSTKIPDGTYSVSVHTVNDIGEATDSTAANVLVIDTVPPATPTVNSLITNNNQPVLTGTWDQSTPGGAVVLQVTLNSTTYTLGSSPQLTSDGSGHWTLTTSTTIPDGTYAVSIHTADAAGNVANATVAGALIVDTVPPAPPTVNSLITNNNQPVLTGTWDQSTPGGAVVLQVTLNGTTYTLGSSPQLTTDGSGHWTLTTSAKLADGTYAISIHTADAAGNVANATVAGALIVDTVPPAPPTVNALVTHNSQPILTGTWDQSTPGGAVLLQVTLNGTTYTLGSSPQLTSDGAGHWTLTTSTTIPDGTYSVTVHTADAAGNVANTTVAGALIVDTVPPATPTVNSQTTSSTTPTVTGTWDATKAVVLQVTISNSAASYSATYSLGSSSQLTTSGGSWTLNLAGTTPLAAGTYNVLVHTVDQYGLTADSTGGVLVVNLVQNNLLVAGAANVVIGGSNATASYNFDVKFVSGGVQLTGTNGTTFNGQASLVIASVKSLAVQLGNGNNVLRVTGIGPAVSLTMGTGQNDVTFRNFTGGKVQVSSAGVLSVHARISTMSSLTVTGGTSADLFEASQLQVSGNTQLELGGGANTVRIDESQFNNFKLDSTGAGARILIETGAAEGTGTVFNGSTVMQLGGGAVLTFSPLSTSDPTTFNGNLNINAGTPNAKWHRQNVVFAKQPVLHNVTIV